MKLLKEESIESNMLWRDAGKPRKGSIFDRRQKYRSRYRKRLRDHSNDKLTIYNALHESLLQKMANVLEVLRFKFESTCRNSSVQVDGCVDHTVVAGKFADHFSRAYTSNSASRAEELKLQ